MAHERNRYIKDRIQNALSFSGIVGVLGHRQVGKTTLLEQLTKKYVTFDQKKNLLRAKTDPEQFIQDFKLFPSAIDEAQYVPEIFPALKELVRVNKRPGLFLLSGSVRFTSKKLIKESLTGRIVNLELLPFSISELEQRPLPSWAMDCAKSRFTDQSITHDQNWIRLAKKRCDSYLATGGLPGACFLRNSEHREDRFESQIETILDRDLRQVLDTKISYERLRELLRHLALQQGNPFEWTHLSRSTRISIPSLRKLIPAFEAIFLIRIIPTEGTEKKSICFLEDQGEAEHLIAGSTPDHQRYLRLLFSYFRHQYHYRLGLSPREFQYRNHGGAYVPFAVHLKTGTLGFVILETENPSESHLASGRSFLKKYPNSKKARAF